MQSLPNIPPPPDIPGLTPIDAIRNATLPLNWFVNEQKNVDSDKKGSKVQSNAPLAKDATAVPVKMFGYKDRYQCSMCEVTASMYTVKAHISRDHLHLPPQQCTGCSYKTFNTACFAAHIKACQLIESGQPYKCSHCPFVTAKSWTLKRHMISHSKDQAFQCTHCHKSYKLKQNLRRHEKKQKCSYYVKGQ